MRTRDQLFGINCHVRVIAGKKNGKEIGGC